MNPDKPLVNRLTLLVLSLILVCLVLLVVRAYQKPGTTGEPPAMAETEISPVVAEESPPAEPSTPMRPPQVVRRTPTTNTVRVSSPARSSGPVNSAVPEAGAPPAQFADRATALVAVSEGEHVGGALISGGPSPGTSLSGWVTLTGTPPPEIPISLGPTCSSLRTDKVTTRHFVVSREGGLANVLVYVANARSSPPLVEPPVLDQIGCMFEPYVFGVVAGQKFKIRNSDSTLHNIHATPRNNREFNIAQAARGQVDTFSFPKHELFVRIKCDVHPWMFAYVNVLRHPFFAITDTNGVFRLPAGLPAGDYHVRAFHLKAGDLTQQVRIGDGEQRTLHFEFSVQPGAQPQGRVALSN